MKLTPYAQEEPHTCVVACLRIVAEYYGHTYSEVELLSFCQTTLDGTTPEALVEAADKIGLTAKLTFDDPAILSLAVHQQQPMIVYLGIPALSLELEIHAVVVSDLTFETVTYLDPTDGKEHAEARDSFFAHWQTPFIQPSSLPASDLTSSATPSNSAPLLRAPVSLRCFIAFPRTETNLCVPSGAS